MQKKEHPPKRKPYIKSQEKKVQSKLKMARPFFECHFLGQPHTSHKFSSKSYSKTPDLQKKQHKIHTIQNRKPLFVLVYTRELEKKNKTFSKAVFPPGKISKNVYIFRQTFRIQCISQRKICLATRFLCETICPFRSTKMQRVIWKTKQINRASLAFSENLFKLFFSTA